MESGMGQHDCINCWLTTYTTNNNATNTKGETDTNTVDWPLYLKFIAHNTVWPHM